MKLLLLKTFSNSGGPRWRCLMPMIAMLASSLIGYAQQKQLVQIKTFDEKLVVFKNIEISVNGVDYIQMGSKGAAFAELSTEHLPPKTIKVKDQALEAASWNYTKGVLEIIVRKKNYTMINVVVRNENETPVSGVKISYKTKQVVSAVTDRNGQTNFPLPVEESLNEKLITVDGEKVSKVLIAGNNATIYLASPAPVIASSSVQSKPEAQPERTDTYNIDFAISKLDSIQSLTMFYSVFKNYQIKNLSEDLKRKVDAKFNQLVADLEDSLQRTETLFIGRISDSSFVGEDLKNLIEQASLENTTLASQKDEFDEKIRIISEKLDAGIVNMDDKTRSAVIADLNRLQLLLSENESRFYKNQNYYYDVISSLREKYFDFKDIENKLFISEAQRMEDKQIFRQRLLLTIALIVIFGILIIRLIYFSNQLRAEKQKLQVANTEIQHINANLENLVYQRTKLLEEANKELDTFLYRASHDLRSPVCSIIGLCNLASHFSGGEAKELLDKVVFTTTGMDKMLKKLSLISEINQPTNFSPVNVRNVIETTIQNLETIINSNHLKMEIDCEAQLEIYTYPNLFDAVITNVVENAVQFTAMKNSPAPVITVSVSKDDTNIKIAIRDNGVGIDKRISNRLFDMFFKGNVFSKGNGLGLYIVQKSIAVLKGDVTFESEAGVYTQFNITLPLVDAPLVVEPAKDARPELAFQFN
ncbi:MAG TPA: HAMP domain-containing sensor histidine kinase [Chryseosolibacter sp.]|nr:HAMP domain-containing sensor histidine kinase [Chryseosolibacter sp.]